MKEEISHKIVEIARMLFQKNLAFATGGNICVKKDEYFYVTPHGMGNFMLYRINPSDIIIIDKNFNIIQGKGTPSIETKLHINILLELKDYNVSIHTHGFYSNAFGYADEEIPVVSPVTEALVGRMLLVEEAKPGSDKLAKGCFEKVLEIKNERKGLPIGLMMKKHGVLALAKDLEGAYTAIDAMEEAARCSIFSGLIKLLANEKLLENKLMY